MSLGARRASTPATRRGMSQGRANYSMEPLTYKPVPPNIAKGLLEKSGD